MSTKQESISGAAFKAWPFSPDFNFAFKYGQLPQQHANTSVHWL